MTWAEKGRGVPQGQFKRSTGSVEDQERPLEPERGTASMPSFLDPKHRV